MRKIRSFNNETKSWQRNVRQEEQMATLELRNTRMNTNKELKGLNNGIERLLNLNEGEKWTDNDLK